MPEQKPISLYQCNACGKQVFEDRIAEGHGCGSCGVRYVRFAPPTFYYIAGYFLHNPKMLWRYIVENIFGGEELIQDA